MEGAGRVGKGKVGWGREERVRRPSRVWLKSLSPIVFHNIIKQNFMGFNSFSFIHKFT